MTSSPARAVATRAPSVATDRTSIVVMNAAVAVVYWGLAEIVLLPGTESGGITPIWPPAGLAVALVFLGGNRLIPGIVLGAFAVMSSRVPLLFALLVAIATLLEPIIDVRILRALKFDARLERVRDPLLLSLIAAPAGALVVAALGVGLYAMAGRLPANQITYGFALWWLRNWLGVILAASLIFTWVRPRPIAWTWPRIGEALALFLAMLVAAQLMFGLWSFFARRDVPIAFVFFPLVGWAGLRFGARGAATVVAVIAAFALGIAGLGIGPFVTFPIQFIQFLLFTFLMMGSLSGHLLAAMMAERDDALARRLALEEQLRHSQKMEAVGRLAGGIAHDFNNLLTAIIGYTELVLTSLDAKHEARGDAEEIARAAMRAADLTRQMLAFSRRQVLQPKVIDLNTSVMTVEPMLRRLIGENIVLTVSAKAEHARVRVDPGQVEQVIMNLVVNSRDAMPKGGRLTVETGDAALTTADISGQPDAQPGTYVLLTVSDTGVGMAPEIRSRVFEPYFTTKEIGKGTGLGLSTAYGIVRQSEGHIALSSEVGRGTTVRVYLPRAEAAPAEVVPTGVVRMPGGTEHVLLVEDDVSVRRLSKELLTRLGYSVTEAASGRAGIALGSDDTRHFDIAVCDVILGDMSGAAVAEALRALRPSIRVLYMSGYVDDAIVRTGVLDEGRPFLQKPFTPVQLATKIRELLDQGKESVRA